MDLVRGGGAATPNALPSQKNKWSWSLLLLLQQLRIRWSPRGR